MSAARSSRAGERLIVAFLLVAAVVLLMVFVKIRRPAAQGADAFDFRNPLLGARVGECVSVKSREQVTDVTCLRVIEPGAVLRPFSEGPESVPTLGRLRRAPPYLLCQVRYPPPGRTCIDEGGREEYEALSLNAFGMPSSTTVEIQSIRPTWVRWASQGDRYVFVYEIQLMRFGYLSGPITLYVDPLHPVGGVIWRRDTGSQGQAYNTVFTAVEGCR